MSRRVHTLALASLLAALAFGVAAELAVGAPRGLALAIADFGVGGLLLAFGVTAWLRRSESWTGVWMGLAGLTWSAGTLGWPLVALHRGFLVPLHLSYPSGRLPRPWLARVAIAAALVTAAAPPLARDDWLTVALAALVAAAAFRVFLGAGGVDRAAALPALAAAVAFAAILSLGAALRLSGVEAERPVLWSYDLVIAALAGVLLIDLLRARWSEAVLRGLVVDLGALRGTATLQQRLARALGDPRLRVGVWDDHRGAYLDESDVEVTLPRKGSGLVATQVDDVGERLALLVLDEAASTDRQLVASAVALARTAVANRALEARVAVRSREIAASRRRLVEAADEERRALQRALAHGPERRLRRVSDLVGAVDGAGPIWLLLRQELDAAIAQLHELAKGVHPVELADGLPAALRGLAAQSPLEVSVAVDVPRLPETIEAAAFFVCAEALANAAKHARTSSAQVWAAVHEGRFVLEIGDFGAGGADGQGAGLRGLADRIEGLGGRFFVQSATGAGTRVLAEIPCDSS